MKKLSLMLVLVSGVAWAGGHNVNQEQNTVVIVNAPAGPQGPKGDSVMGLKGEKGDAGQDYDGDHRLTTNVGADIQWYDWQHASIRSGYRYDFNHKGHTVDIGVLTIKVGKSYTDRRIEEMEKMRLELRDLAHSIEAIQRLNSSKNTWIKGVHPDDPIIAIPLKTTIRGQK